MLKKPLSLFKKAGLKTTSARQAILDIFSDQCKPLNAEYIYGKLKSKNINQATVYRTLGTLLQSGIIKRVDLRKDSMFYELASSHHHHLVCTRCGRVEEFDTCSIDDVSKKILKQSTSFVSIKQHSLEFFGLCKTCAKR